MDYSDNQEIKEIIDQNKPIIDKFGLDACMQLTNIVTKEISSAMENGKPSNPTKIIRKTGESLGATNSEAISMHMIGMKLKLLDLNVDKFIKKYNENRDNLPDCPVSRCEGKLHLMHSMSEEFNGAYHCDACERMFKRKKK